MFEDGSRSCRLTSFKGLGIYLAAGVEEKKLWRCIVGNVGITGFGGNCLGQLCLRDLSLECSFICFNHNFNKLQYWVGLYREIRYSESQEVRYDRREKIVV